MNSPVIGRRQPALLAAAALTLALMALGCGAGIESAAIESAAIESAVFELAALEGPAVARWRPSRDPAPAVQPAASPVLSSQPWQSFESEGIHVDLFLDRLAAQRDSAKGRRSFTVGEDIQVRFRLAFAGSSEPYTGAYPAAWMASSKSATATTSSACRERVELFVGGSLFSRAELDLNVYYVVTLNDDSTLSVVDPLFGFGGSKLLTLVELGGRGEDWVLSTDGERLLVTVPENHEAVVVDTRSWAVTARLALASRPGRVRWHAPSRTAWVLLGGSEDSDGSEGSDAGAVAVVDPRHGRLLHTLALGHGPHDLAFSADGETAFVTNQGDGTVAVIDTLDFHLLHSIHTGAEPVSVTFSDLAGAAFVSHRGDGRIAVLRRGNSVPVATIQAEPGLGQIRFPSGGRYGFALNPRADLAHVIDGASNRIVQTGDLPGGPDQVTFSRELAYLRHRDHETILMVPLAAIGRPGAPLPVVDFPGGQSPFSAGSGTALADNLVQTPGETAVLVAHPADQAVYFYKEGMAAPMGSFRNYGREPRAVLVVDRSLRESQPGEYTTTVRLRKAGQYDLALFLQSPLMTHCFPVQVEAAPGEGQAASVRVSFPDPNPNLVAGREGSLTFDLIDEHTGQPIRDLVDVRVLLMRSSGRWHTRLAARARGTGYVVEVQPPSAGSYVVAVASASAPLALHRGGGLSFQVSGSSTEPSTDDATRETLP